MTEINNLTRTIIDKKLLISVAEGVLKKEKREKVDLSIVLVSPKTIKKLNKKYRRKNLVTDVLSFQYANENENKKSGEIVICPWQVRKNAKKFNSTFKKELIKILVHGILHLSGFDHERNKKEANVMAKKEEYYFILTNKLCRR